MADSAVAGALPGQLELLEPAPAARGRSPEPLRPLARPAAPPQALPEAGTRELWLAVYLPGIALEALQGEFTGDAPRAVLDEAERARILLVDEAAREAGVRPGLPLAAALALCATLETRVRDAAREQAWLERAAALALGFTPRVSLEPPDAVLLEVRGSQRLFGGLGPLQAGLEAACREQRMRPLYALAPTPRAALAGARAGRKLQVTSLARLAGALAPLPLAALRWDADTLARLAALGVRSVGEALRLPRAGFARRFGAGRLTELDELVGRRGGARRGFRAPERFRARFEPDYELESLPAVLAMLDPLLGDLEHFLEARQRGITVLSCRLAHRQGEPTRCVLRLAAPEARAAQFARLLAERLGTLTLRAPVRRCELRTGPLMRRPLANEALWRSGEHGGEGAGTAGFAFIEQLRARLGREGVYSPGLRADHRPELIARAFEPRPGAGPGSGARELAGGSAGLPWSVARRPLWLLADPRPLPESRGRPCGEDAGLLELLELLGGPERIESGWWDGTEVGRDYYVARDARGALLWIFRERALPHRWFLHGLFG